MSAQPLLELQHLERLELHRCNPTDGYVEDALLQLSSLSSLTDVELNIRVEDFDEEAADALLALPSLRGLVCGTVVGLGWNMVRSVMRLTRFL
jgi:hypothetical protein